MQKKVSLTGVKPTGTPHLGNWLGAIKPAIEATASYDARYFIADYHALNSIKDAALMKKLTYEVAATWLAFGLDPQHVTLYKQSAVPEIFELTVILNCFTAKGLMNRAHAYKAVVADNKENDRDPDYGINMGLFTYPILMAADILMFGADVVPVGKDQVQHIEMCIDIAEALNHAYQTEVVKIPAPLISEDTQLIVGLDGRKMSKSYNNAIPCFLPAKNLRKVIMRITTNSQGVEEPKDPDTCSIFALYKLFATADEQQALRQRYVNGGMGWGEAKQALFEVMDRTLSPYRSRYEELMADLSYIDKVLAEGAAKARSIATPNMERIRKIVGIC
jgi:tryptophanyl-tRNA synthetase